MAEFTTGQRVRIINNQRYNGLGTVVKVLPKNVDVMLDGGIKVRFAPYYLSTDLAPMTETAYRDIVDNLPPAIGTVVTTKDHRVTGPYVVLAESMRKGVVCVRIAKLGGDGNRYWTFPVKLVTVLPLEDLPDMLLRTQFPSNSHKS